MGIARNCTKDLKRWRRYVRFTRRLSGIQMLCCIVKDLSSELAELAEVVKDNVMINVTLLNASQHLLVSSDMIILCS